MITFHEVPERLTPYVAGFYVIQRERLPNEKLINELCLPSGLCNMAFQYKGDFRVQIHENAFWLPKFYTNGQQVYKYDFICESNYGEITGLVFKPTGLWHFFGLDMAKLTNVAIDTCSLFADGLDTFKAAYLHSKSPEERVELLKELIETKYEEVRPKTNIIDSIVDLINQSKGCISVKGLAEKSGASERYIQRKFKSMIGVSPSVLCRITRFNFLFAEMASDTPQDFKTLSALFNYYDINHFSKDFKRYCGEAPTKFHLDRFSFLKELHVDDPFVLRQK